MGDGKRLGTMVIHSVVENTNKTNVRPQVSNSNYSEGQLSNSKAASLELFTVIKVNKKTII